MADKEAAFWSWRIRNGSKPYPQENKTSMRKTFTLIRARKGELQSRFKCVIFHFTRLEITAYHGANWLCHHSFSNYFVRHSRKKSWPAGKFDSATLWKSVDLSRLGSNCILLTRMRVIRWNVRVKNVSTKAKNECQYLEWDSFSNFHGGLIETDSGFFITLFSCIKIFERFHIMLESYFSKNFFLIFYRFSCRLSL